MFISRQAYFDATPWRGRTGRCENVAVHLRSRARRLIRECRIRYASAGTANTTRAVT